MGEEDTKILNVGIIYSRFNKPVVKELLNSCVDQLIFKGVDEKHILQKEVPLGLAPEVGSSLLLFQSLGYQKAAQLLFDADWISGEEYCELGLARYCGLDFSAQAAAYASKLSEQSLASIVETKAILKTFNADVMAAARKLETTAMKKLYGSEDNLKAVEKFFYQVKVQCRICVKS